MNVVISIYSENAFKEIPLPSLNNADYSIILQSDYYHLKEDISLNLEVLDNTWSIKDSMQYRITTRSGIYSSQPLENDSILMVKTMNDEDLSIIVRFEQSIFRSYNKYNIGSLDRITIGKDFTKDIVYNYLNLVSSDHATIEKTKNGYKIINECPNGINVNSVRVINEVDLKFGDFINIIGLHIVFLGNVLAIDDTNDKVRINNPNLRVAGHRGDETVLLGNIRRIDDDENIYHRAPRNYEHIPNGEIEIEGPPQKTETEQQPLYMVVGPAFTMALPMILGCSLMMYSSGSGSSLYMMSGLIMSVSSAVVGVVWAVMNMNYQKKADREKEAHRIQAYGDYLLEKAKEVKSVYDDSIEKLNELYPAPASCLQYDKESSQLWNRNITHPDYLQHRLGIGTMPFPTTINVPKKRFMLYPDELDDKPRMIQQEYSNLYNVPVTIDLVQNHLIGIVGGPKKKGAIEIAKILSAQIAANNSYTDVKLGYIYNGKASSDYNKWTFTKWLPHVWNEEKKVRFVAENKEDASDVFYELTTTLRARLEEKRNKEQKIQKPYYVIIVSDPSLLEDELFAKYAFEKENDCSLTTILLVERYEELPNDCELVIENTDVFTGIYNLKSGISDRKEIAFDKVRDEDLEAFSRYISNLKVLEMEEGGEVPNSLTFFEMLKINKLTDLPVKTNWAKNRTYENIRGQLGEKAGGVPCYLDVHEKYHGPHGLVAGTTGSGKSETLQSYLLSLAINYSPYDVGFFIIDYKGGGMANLFNGLPHLIGQISNLSGNQVNRAMISIKSENHRRQRIFAENGVNNINAYTKLVKTGEATLPIPHMFIVVDEFAELKREEPEFMKELISIAQVGRSLGVHLILATQKPSGTVDDNIWSNSKFKLCLRVQDRQDSMDMLHKPDAAYITQAGRSYLQVGNDEVYELFQSGYSGAVYNEDMMSDSSDIAKLITLSGRVELTGNAVKLSQKKRVEEKWIDTLIDVTSEAMAQFDTDMSNQLGDSTEMDQLIALIYQCLDKKGIDYPESKFNTSRLKEFVDLYNESLDFTVGSRSNYILKKASSSNIKLPQAKEKTQLDAIKSYLAVVANDNGYTHRMQLWLPVLKDHIYLNEFDDFNRNRYSHNGWRVQEGEWKLDFVLGKMDDPASQNQMPLMLDFADDGHIAIFGSIVCGKSTMMQTIAYALIQKYTPDYVNIYALDFSSHVMDAFKHAPHVGGIMYDSDLDKIDKFFNMIDVILEERKALFRGGNYKQYVHVNGVTLPSIIIFIDNYSSFKEKTEEMYEEKIIRLSKEGISHGIYLVISGTSVGMNDIPTRLAENFATVLTLSLSDRYAYSELLRTMAIDVLPETGIKGRGLAYYGSRVLEFQTALALEAENDFERNEKIDAICIRMANTWTGKKARPVPEIPEKPVWSEFKEVDGFDKYIESPYTLPVGYDASNATIYNIPLSEVYCYTIYGEERSGKHNFLHVCLKAALEKDAYIAIFDDENKMFGQYADSPSIDYITNDQEAFEYFKKLLPVFKARNAKKHELIDNNSEENEIFEVMSKEIPYFIFISDLSWFVPMIYNSSIDMKGFLENIISKGSLHNIYFFSLLSMNKRSDISGYGVYEAFVGHKTGIHFGGKVSENPILTFEHMNYVDQNKAEKPNIGILPDNMSEEVTKVVVPAARR